MSSIAKPDPFLIPLIVENDKDTYNLTVLHAGFEMGVWRCAEFATHILDWLPEFALSHTEYTALGSHNAGLLMRKAAQKVFNTDAYQRRGEFGEIILHAAVRQVYDSIPAISKIFFKDSANDVVKGFDIVHLVGTDEDLELWLGEAKFYEDCKAGLKAAEDSLKEHFERDYLREECTFILDKFDSTHPLYERMKQLLHTHSSLDTIIKRIVVPVMVTYDSDILTKHIEDTKELKSDLIQECQSLRDWWVGQSKLDLPVRILFFLIPLSTKKTLNEQLATKLKGRQERD